MDKLGDVAIFVRVVESGSFTDAAEQLQISKSVISKYVSRLERRLGARLLNRTTRRLSLTEAGRIFYARSLQGLRVIEEAESQVSQLQGAVRGNLRVNAPMSFGIKCIAGVIPDFMAEYPDVTLDLHLDDRQVDLIEEGFDLAIRIADLPESSLVARRLGTCRHVVCASPAYLDIHGRPETPDDLNGHNIITYRYRETPNEWRFTSSRGGYVSIPVTGTVQMNNSLAIREAVLNGLGITLTPRFIVSEDIRENRIETLLADYRTQDIAIYAVYPQREYLSPKVRAFIDFIGKSIAGSDI